MESQSAALMDAPAGEPSPETVPRNSGTWFNSEKARLAGQKSGEARRRAKAERDRPTTESTVEQSVQAPPVDDFVQAKLSRIEAQIDRLDELIDEETKRQPKQVETKLADGKVKVETVGDWPSSKVIIELTKAKGELFEQRRILRRDPLPGSLRPVAAKTRAGGVLESL